MGHPLHYAKGFVEHAWPFSDIILDFKAAIGQGLKKDFINKSV